MSKKITKNEVKGIFKFFNWISFFEAAQILDDNCKKHDLPDGTGNSSSLSFPRDYLYAISLELLLKQILANKYSFVDTKDYQDGDRHHCVKKHYGKIKNNNLCEAIADVGISDSLLEAVTDIISETGRYSGSLLHSDNNPYKTLGEIAYEMGLTGWEKPVKERALRSKLTKHEIETIRKIVAVYLGWSYRDDQEILLLHLKHLGLEGYNGNLPL